MVGYKTVRALALVSWMAALPLAGCGGGGGDGGTPLTPEELIAAGWASFEGGDYAEARDFFQASVNGADGAEARNGLGWSLARLDQLDTALAQFDASLAFSSADPEPFAGRSAVARDVDPPQFAVSIASADSALARDPAFAFAHDSSVNWMDLRLIIAQSAYGLGDYARAVAEVDSLPEGIPPDPGSPNLAEELLTELERLGNLLHSRMPAGG